eukprot:Skav202614  [mRNA]  locus=scaffold3002:13240:32251:- [translate_table: standard]
MGDTSSVRRSMLKVTSAARHRVSTKMATKVAPPKVQEKYRMARNTSRPDGGVVRFRLRARSSISSCRCTGQVAPLNTCKVAPKLIPLMAEPFTGMTNQSSKDSEASPKVP